MDRSLKKELIQKSKLKYSYYPVMLPYVKGKVVLDCGCCQHGLKHIAKSKKSFVHGFLYRHAKKLIGIDNNKKAVEEMRAIGFDNMYYMNAEDINFDIKFDTIFAGELIEHLSNRGLFIESCRKALKKDGRLIITTPNAFSFWKVWKMIYQLNDIGCNDEHTCWHTPKVLKHLLSRYGLEVEKIEYGGRKFFIDKLRSGMLFICKISDKPKNKNKTR